MAEYYMAELGNNCYRLRVELNDEIAQFTFLYFEKNYNILTYAFLPKMSAESQLFKSIGGWKKVSREKALPIIESGMEKYKAMMTAFETEPNF